MNYQEAWTEWKRSRLEREKALDTFLKAQELAHNIGEAELISSRDAAWERYLENRALEEIALKEYLSIA